jgi:transposase
VITPGQAHDVTAFPALMQEIDCDPEQMLGDKGYDSEAVRNDIEERGGEAAIPSTATRKIQHAVDKALYALRNRIERFFNRAKNSRRVATRYDSALSINLICQFFPSFRHFFQNTSMALGLGLEFSEPYALFRKPAILS